MHMSKRGFSNGTSVFPLAFCRKSEVDAEMERLLSIKYYFVLVISLDLSENSGQSGNVLLILYGANWDLSYY